MALLHTIRLAGPWEYEPIERAPSADLTADLPPPGRVQLPADWGATLGADFRGRVRYRRGFGRPTGLSPSDRVWLVLERLDAWGEVTLNGDVLGRAGAAGEFARFEVTDRLAERNLLLVVVELPAWNAALDRARRPDRHGQPGGLIGPVRLEIHDYVNSTAPETENDSRPF